MATIDRADLEASLTLERERASRAEAQLAESQRVAHVGSWEWDIVANKITWTDELYHLYGLRPQEFPATYESFLERVHPDDRALVDRAVREAFENGESFAFDHRIVRPDGAHRWLHGRGQVVAAAGQPVRMVGSAQDITDRRHAEEALRRSEERTRAILESAHEAFVSIDADGRITDWNPAATRTFGWSHDEAIGGPMAEILIPSRYQESHRLGMARFLSTGKSSVLGRRLELVACHRDGHEFPVELTISAVRSGNGHFFHAFIHDITDRSRAEEALREAQKLESLGLLAGGVAHDLNNLLGAVLGQATLAARKLPPESPARIHLEKAMDAVDRAADLARQMLAYSGRGHFRLQPISLNRLIRESVHLFSGAAVPRNVQVRSELLPGLPLIEADAGQMQQVLINLVLNATEAIGEKPGLVIITTGTREVDAQEASLWEQARGPLPAGRYVSLEVRDDGRGMEPETLKRLFDPFFTTKAVGRGLGLAAVLGIVRGHHGALRTTSQPGKGTSFRVIFPAVPGSDEKDAGASGETAPAFYGGTVLVIDDEAALREVVTDMLATEGFEVLVASDGTTGLDLYRQHADRVRFVLLDLSMPGLSGAETFEALRRMAPEVKVILTSGYSEAEVMKQFVGRGLAGFIQKPFRLDGFMSEVARCLGPP